MFIIEFKYPESNTIRYEEAEAFEINELKFHSNNGCKFTHIDIDTGVVITVYHGGKQFKQFCAVEDADGKLVLMM